MIPLQSLESIKNFYRMMQKTHPSLVGFVLATALSVGTAQAAPRAIADGTANAMGGSPQPVVMGDISGATDYPGAHSAEADDRLKRADAHFNNGRQLYFQSDMTGARREFDAAVEALLSAPESLTDHRRIERRLDEICDLIYRFDVEKLGAGQPDQDAVVFDRAPIDEISHMTFAVDPTLTSKLSLELKQTASGIPLELSDPVLSYVHYFSTDSGRRTLLAGLRRSGRYKALIERVFAEEGIPQELLFLAQAESGFLPRAVSNKQAVGMWQFIAGTGSTYDLGRSGAYDERLDPEKATRAAAKYLRDLHTHFGDWYLAMAAYNCGAGAVDRAIERTGYADYWELLNRRALPKETANYVPIILAMTIMAKNPQDYGLESIDADPALEYDSIHITASTNLNLISDATMQPLSVIRDLNPALLKTVAPAGFEVHVPKGSADATIAALESVPAESRLAWRLHHVEAGDTLDAIATSYHLTPERIAAVNRSTDSLEAGDILFIPAAYHQEAPSTHGHVRGSHARGTLAGAFRSNKTGAVRQSTHISASHRLPAQVLHRRAVVRTARLER